MMKSLIAFATVLLSLTACRSSQTSLSEGSHLVEASPDVQQAYSPTTLIIMVNPEIGKGALLKAVKQYKAELVYDYQNFSAIAVRKPKDKTLEDTIDYFKKVEGVVSVERDAILQLH